MVHQVAVEDEEVLVAGVFVRGARGAGLQPVDVEAGSDTEGVVQLEDGFSRPQGLPVAIFEVGHGAEVRADRIQLRSTVDPLTVIHPHILRVGLIRIDRWPSNPTSNLRVSRVWFRTRWGRNGYGASGNLGVPAPEAQPG